MKTKIEDFEHSHFIHVYSGKYICINRTKYVERGNSLTKPRFKNKSSVVEYVPYTIIAGIITYLKYLIYLLINKILKEYDEIDIYKVIKINSI